MGRLIVYLMFIKILTAEQHHTPILYRVTWLVVKTDTFLCSKDSLVRVQNTANTESDTANTRSDTANTEV